MSLHISYRVTDFDGFVGNEITIKTIKSIFERERKDIPHNFLFIGEGGTGKTTLGRIVAEKLGCPPITGNPDFLEINAASKGGIDTEREIEASMRFAPMNSKARVYLFEEVQRSSPDFREAMLNKCMEFGPSHAYFIFCTTNPEKLGMPNGPFRRRCHTFEMKKLTDKEMSKLVWRVIKDEGVEDYFNEEVIDALIKQAGGSAGAALGLLDKIIDLEPEDMIDAISISEKTQKQTIDLCRSLLNGTWDDVAEILNGFDEDPERTRHAINGYMQSVILKQKTPGSKIFDRALLVMECFGEPNFYNGKPGLTKACADVFS